MNYTIREMEEDEFREYFNKYKGEVFGEDHNYVLWDLLDENEMSKVNKLRENMGNPYNLRLGAFSKDDEFLGWHWGFQKDATTFYMCNSAVLKPYRKQGIYTALLNKAVSLLKEKGFQEIYSRHCATNNSVLIPKLKAGFIISKFELSDVFGVLVHLSYFTNPTRKKIMDYRCGELRPDEKIRSLFKI